MRARLTYGLRDFGSTMRGGFLIDGPRARKSVYWLCFVFLGCAWFASCRCEAPRDSCTRDLECGPDEVCYFDGRCLPREIAILLPIPPGDSCVVRDGKDDGCAPDAICRNGRCVEPAVGVDAGQGDGAVSPACETHLPQNERPLFGGLVEGVQDGNDAVLLRWFPAVDETAPEAIRYRVYTSTRSPATDHLPPRAEVTGETNYRVTGLLEAVPYYFVVRAVDLEGQEDCNTKELSVTLSPPLACVDFRTQVLSIFTSRCTYCHGGSSPAQNLRLDSYEGVLLGGNTGGEVVACRPADSLLVRKVADASPPVGRRMPFDGPPFLADSQIATIRRWIEEGARATCEAPNPCGDTTPPTFSGVKTATLTRTATAARLCWDAASDDTTPTAELTYAVYQASSSHGQDFSRAPALISSAGASCVEISGLLPLSQYCFVVRARDAAANDDGNTVERCVTTPAAACIDYATMIQPLFDRNCIRCHSGVDAPQNLRLDTYAGTLAGGRSGNEVVACQSSQSLLFQKVAMATPPIGARMPLDGPPYLAAAEMDALRAWIDAGARRSCNDVDPCSDAIPPTFSGLDSATLSRTSSAARLCWRAASDNAASPAEIVYSVWESSAPGQQDFGSLPRMTTQAGSTCVEVTGLTPGSNYCWVTRARDRAGNMDANSVERCVTTPAASCIEYSTVVQPIFNRNCTRCHAGASAPQNLRLDSYVDVLLGGQTGSEVIACQPNRSLLVQKIAMSSPPIGARMPFDGPPFLAAGEISAITQWVAEGARATCAQADPCSDRSPPTFGGLSSVSLSSGGDSARLCWVAASDDVTPAARLVYDVFEASTPQGEDFSRPPRATSALGATCLDVAGLVPSAEYCWVVRARDGAGNSDNNVVERCITTPASSCLEYTSVIQPIFNANCTRCHSGASPPAGLRLDTHAGTLRGGLSGGEVVACNSASSLLYQKITLATPPVGVRMPFDGPPYLSTPQTDAIRDWIDQGARASCATADPCSDHTPPSYSGLATLRALDATRAELCWTAATDAVTPQGELVYDAWDVTTDQSLTRPPTKTSPPGETCMIIDALSPTAEACFLVRARDAAGNRDANAVRRCVTLLAVPAGCVDFATMIQPIFTRHCNRCHAQESAPQRLRLDSYANVMAGSIRRNEVRACAASQSLLVQKISANPPLGRRMPWDGPPYLTPAQVSLVAQWIQEGATEICQTSNTCADSTPPAFGGVTSVAALDETTMRVCWAAASDNTTSASHIRYDVYQSSTAGNFPFGEPAPIAVVGELCVPVKVAPATQMCFAVRARDTRGNVDNNTVSRCATTPAAACAVEFSSHVSPILKARCAHCHYGTNPPRGFDVGSYGAVVKGGVLRNEVRACDANSFLLRKIAGGVCGRRMPWDGPPYLSLSERSLLSNWIQSGARQTCAEANPCADSTAPSFAGLASATVVDPSTVELSWVAATDSVSPASAITYDIYEASAANGFNFARPAPFAASPGQTSFRLRVAPAQQSCYVVRARDVRQSRDTNSVSRCLTTPGHCIDSPSLVQPIFDSRCIHCHSGPQAPRGIRWDSYARASSNDEVEACRPDNSKMVEMIEACDMPLDTSADQCNTVACLAPSSLRILRGWVGEGLQETCSGSLCP